MAQQLYDYDGNPVHRASAGTILFNAIFIGGFLLIVGAVVATFLGISPARLTTSAPVVQPTSAPQAPRVPSAPVVAPQAPIVVQSVPQGAVAQPISIPQPAPQAPPVDAPAAAPQPKPIVIVLHEREMQGAPIVTGSGACNVAKGARKCGK